MTWTVREQSFWFCQSATLLGLETGPASHDPHLLSLSSFSSHQWCKTWKSLYGVLSLNRHGFEVRWDMETLWRHMAFLVWPTFANQYNFSLAYRRLVVFEPIHIVETVVMHCELDRSAVGRQFVWFYPTVSEHGITETLLCYYVDGSEVLAHFWQIKWVISAPSSSTPVRMLHAPFQCK